MCSGRYEAQSSVNPRQTPPDSIVRGAAPQLRHSFSIDFILRAQLCASTVCLSGALHATP